MLRPNKYRSIPLLKSSSPAKLNRLKEFKMVKWPWLFVEVWPGYGFAEEVDYRSVLYGRVRVDIHYGHFFEGEETVIEE